MPKLSMLFASETRISLQLYKMRSIKGTQKTSGLRTEICILSSHRWYAHTSSFVRCFMGMVKKTQPRSLFTEAELAVPDQVLFCRAPSLVCTGGTWQSLLLTSWCFFIMSSPPPTVLAAILERERAVSEWLAFEQPQRLCCCRSADSVAYILSLLKLK